ncbi:kinase binding protein CGI-121-domain-containing protein [Paraphoma chrysanthemicola]|uniref:EKC/KEOPS complex subunit CGI121 n=1 Tax=Paraphoma chrysanthemicola TaxID=798071 RepID=A0A8K0RET0_9PLEO|nr:kinase binding protein CGI-121-domain-containing protein [Paraphoma chrysanthemicola]
MAQVQTLTLPHYSAYPVHVALFKHVANAAFLRSQLLEANPEFDYAFLDAEMILSQNHLLTATFLALHAILTSRSKTRTPHSELVFRLSPNNNIGESYKKFGLSDTTSSLIAVKLPLRPSSASSPGEAAKEWTLDESITNESVSKHLGDVVKGTSVKIGERGEELGECCDEDKVRKVYKLVSGGVKGKKGAVNGDAGMNQRKDLESVILGTMTLKGS